MIRANAKTLHELLTMGHFEPAKIQREYQWETDQVGRLINDLVASFQTMGLDPGEPEGPSERDEQEKAEDGTVGEDGGDQQSAPVRRQPPPTRQRPESYFLGNLIVFTAGRSTKYVVYDGLQRLTTLTILLAILRDTWTSLQQHDMNDIAPLLFEGPRQRRLLFPTSAQTLAAISNGTALPRAQLSTGDFRMRDNEKYLREQFDVRWPAERRRAFLSFLRTRVRFAVTETDNHSVAYQMFVGANARGLKLEVGDVLKGVIAEQIRENGGTVEQVETCARIWKEAQQTLRGGFEDFINAIEIYLFRPDASGKQYDEHSTGEMLKDMFDEKTPPEKIIEWLQGDFARMLKVFARSREHLRQDRLQGVDLLFRHLSFLGWKEWQPFLLAVGLRHDNFGSAVFRRRIYDLRRASYILELLDSSAFARRRKFLEATHQLETGADPFAWKRGTPHPGPLYFAPNGGVRSAKRALRMPLTSGERRGAIVRLVETLHWGNTVPGDCTDDASVEHVLPKASVGNWARLFTENERDHSFNLLGNLCLIDKLANFRIGNKDWDAKKAEYENKKDRFKSVASVLRASSSAASGGKPWSDKIVDSLTEEFATLAEGILARG